MEHKRKISDKIKSGIKAAKEYRTRFGTAKMIQHVFFRLVNNQYFCFNCMHFIQLDRENLKPPNPARLHRLSTRIATREDIQEMEKQGCWQLPSKVFERFDRNNYCLLSYIDNNLAGYTWVLDDGDCAVFGDIKLIGPEGYLYNWAGFTLPQYRGHGLQSFRHYELLNHPRWKDKKGLVGYVSHTNYRSKQGQRKSGYIGVGKVYVIGRKSNIHAFIGEELLKNGFKRMKSSKNKKS